MNGELLHKTDRQMSDFNIGDSVIILSDNNWQTVIEDITKEGALTKYWSKASGGYLCWCEGYEMEHVTITLDELIERSAKAIFSTGLSIEEATRRLTQNTNK